MARFKHKTQLTVWRKNGPEDSSIKLHKFEEGLSKSGINQIFFIIYNKSVTNKHTNNVFFIKNNEHKLSNYVHWEHYCGHKMMSETHYTFYVKV